MISILWGCSVQEEQSYSKISINDDLSFELIGPLSKKSRFEYLYHYEIFRDSLNRIIEIKKINGEGREPSGFFLGVPSIKIFYSDAYEKRTYYDQSGLPTKHDGFYSIRIRRNDKNVVTWFGYNQCGKLIKDNSGVCQYRRILDGKKNKIEEMRFDNLGSPITDNSGKYKSKYIYDEENFMIEQSNYDSIGALSNLHKGYSTIKYKYDEKGNETEKAYFDQWGVPVEGPWCGSITRNVYDDRGNRIETSYYDKDGNLYNCSGTAIQKWSWNQSDKLTGVWRFDSDSELVEGTLYKLDQLGSTLEMSYLGRDSQLVMRDWSLAALIKYEYDDFGNTVKTSYFGIDEQPLNTKYGYSSITSQYDKRGRLRESAYWNSQGELVEDSIGVARYRYEYWSDSLEYRKWMFYGNNDQLKSDKKFKVAIVQFTYDTTGNLIEDRYFGPDEKLTEREDRGAAIVRFKYNEHNRLIEQSYYDVNDRLVNRTDLGYAILKQRFNECGYLSEITYFDELQSLVVDSLGNAKYKFEYDDYGNMIRKESYDIHARLNEDSLGFAVYEYEWDEEGNRTKYATYGADGKLKENHFGIAMFLTDYGQGKNVRTISWKNAEGQELKFGRVYGMRLTYDSLDNLSKVENLNKSRMLTTDSMYIAIYQYKYDSVGNRVEILHKDINGKLANCKDGFAINRTEYYSDGTIHFSKYLDTSGKLVEHKQYLCAMYEYFYNESGDKIRTICYDNRGEAVQEWTE